MVETDDFRVSVSQNGKYIVIQVLADMDSKRGRRLGEAATAVAGGQDINLFLFDTRLAPNVQSVVRNYEFAYRELDDFGFPRNSRSALLTAPDDRSHDFMETLFRNAGYSVRLFRDEKQAIDWLESGD